MEKDKSTQLFFSLVYSFQMQTMMHLGKLKNPVSDKIEKDLMAAQATIDLIEMLSEKTKGNLAEEEKRFLESALSDLKLNYVEESSKPEEKIEEKTDSGTENK
ncbi:MAG: DUF1844 domain-containing protein [Bacteroidetes bacterium]|nr:DUF1844 domain-containing protein [Bacteroidota bacterium]MBX7045649.1 DUF1844 domain-containing protein [Ignavibacteria bacterium]